jgi:hypothetical protein
MLYLRTINHRIQPLFWGVSIAAIDWAGSTLQEKNRQTSPTEHGKIHGGKCAENDVQNHEKQPQTYPLVI